MSARPVLLALVLAFAAAGCAAPAPTAAGAVPTDGAQASATVSFARDVAPLMSRSCAGCHGASGPGSRTLTLFDDAGRVRHDATAGKIAGIIRECRTGRMPEGPKPKLSAAEIAKLQAWQAAGAPNN